MFFCYRSILEHLEYLENLEYLEHLERLEHLEHLEHPDNLNLSYYCFKGYTFALCFDMYIVCTCYFDGQYYSATVDTLL